MVLNFTFRILKQRPDMASYCHHHSSWTHLGVLLRSIRLTRFSFLSPSLSFSLSFNTTLFPCFSWFQYFPISMSFNFYRFNWIWFVEIILSMRSTSAFLWISNFNYMTFQHFSTHSRRMTRSDESASAADWELELFLMTTKNASQFYCHYFSKRFSFACVLKWSNYTNTLLLLNSSAIFHEKHFPSFFSMTMCLPLKESFFHVLTKNFFFCIFFLSFIFILKWFTMGRETSSLSFFIHYKVHYVLLRCSSSIHF